MPLSSAPLLFIQVIEGGEVVLSKMLITGQPGSVSGGPGLAIFSAASQAVTSSLQQARVPSLVPSLVHLLTSYLY